MFSNLQQPIVWIVAVAAVAVIGGVGLWLRKRSAGSAAAQATEGAAPDQSVRARHETASSLANIITPSSAYGGTGMTKDSHIADVKPDPASPADRTLAAASDNTAAGAGRPKKGAPAKKPSRKKPASKKPSQKKAARKK